MHRKLNTRISPASLLAIVALFVSLGGVSYAAATIGSGDIVDNSIRSKDVRDKTLRGKDVFKDTLGGDQIDESKLGQVPSALNAQNAVDAQNAVNAQNAVDSQNAVNSQNAQTAASVGPNGVGSAAIQNGSVRAGDLGGTVVRTHTLEVAANGSAFVSGGCLAGEQMLSGGANWEGSSNVTAPNLHLVHSYPVSATSWGARGYNGTGDARDLVVRVVCLAG
jgi:hypothetical protein